jgi:hypothetical protein
MKKLIFICCFILLFALTGCNSNNESNEPSNGNSISGNESQVTETADNTGQGSYVPQKAVPKNLPIYPGAILGSDFAFFGPSDFGDNSWQWNYIPNASGNEIVEFFRTEFENLGFEIDEDFTYALGEEFFVNTTDRIVAVYFLGGDDVPAGVEVTADTPGRHYGIVVDLDKWND